MHVGSRYMVRKLNLCILLLLIFYISLTSCKSNEINSNNNLPDQSQATVSETIEDKVIAGPAAHSASIENKKSKSGGQYKQGEPVSSGLNDIDIKIKRPTIALRVLVHPPVDQDGRKPQDVVAAFVNNVKNADIEAARKWWYRDKKIGKRFVFPSFEDFLHDLRGADLLVVGATGKNKAQYYSGYIAVYRAKVLLTTYYLTLEMVEGQWKIHRDDIW